ncbi:MAG TPA: helix-turn-helix domain-containing protein, partial [Candidatus Dormibacteraeota bacterium]|nr:helix-turn-helix domain-containing protein [Candidatus Dormibacteraeota bacterium]
MSKEKPLETKQPTVGQILKTRRAELGLTMRDIEVATKIRGKYLIQLERDDHHLPNDVYTRGFVQTYANFMGLSGRSLARQYAEERGDVIRAAAARLKPIKTPKIVLTPQFIAVLAASAV